MNILITAATSADAQRLKNKLAPAPVILGDYHDLPEFMKMIRLPNPASASYVHEMLTLCLDKQIDKVYALTNEEIALLKRAEQLFNEYGIAIVHGQ
jgi:hypothetical protein